MTATQLDASDGDATSTTIVLYRALYDYNPPNDLDPASLPLRKDDVLRVPHRPEFGWWDGGMEDERRGWFPSKYVAVLSSTELGLETMLSDQQQLEGGLDGAGRFGMRTRTLSENRIRESDRNNQEHIERSNEFSVPPVTPDSQVQDIVASVRLRVDSDASSQNQNGVAPSWRATARPLPAINPAMKGDTLEVSPIDEGAADEKYEDGPLYPEINLPVLKTRLDKIVGKVICVYPGPVPQSVNRLPAASQPPYMRADYENDTSEILLTPDGGVRGGTLPALVEHLTDHGANHIAFLKAFLMTYSSFTDLNTLFDLLVKRYRLQAPPGLTPSQLQEWTKLKRDIVRVRVLLLFKQMVSDEDFLDEADYHILDRIRELVASPDIASTAPARSVKLALDRRMKFGVNVFSKFGAAPGLTSPPSIVPKTKEELTLLDIDPLELARQLTIRENDLFSNGRPVEYLHWQRSRESNPVKDAPDNLARFIQSSNHIVDWIKATVLAVEDPRCQATVLEYFITLADECRSLRNFFCVFAITTALTSAPLRRLRRTWAHVSARHQATFVACEALVDGKRSFATYRAALGAAQPPCVPFIGLYLTKLNFIHDGNRDMLNDKLINFAKCQKTAETLAEIRRWQSRPYALHAVPLIQAYIEQSLAQCRKDAGEALDERGLGRI